MIEKHNCPLCGGQLGENLLVITVPDRFEVAAGISGDGYKRQWSLCDRCGAAVNVMKKSDEEQLNAYSSNYYEVDLGGNISGKYEMVMGLPAEKSDNAGRVTRVIDYLSAVWGSPHDRKVLDIGSGLGVFLAKFSEMSKGLGPCHLTGVEPDPDAAVHLRELALFDVYEGVFGDDFDQTNFDLITLNKVLEHVNKPHELLSNIHGRLSSEGGVLYVEVPDLLTIKYRDPSDNILGALHKHLYDLPSLTRLLQKTGFEVLQAGRVVEPSGKLTSYAFSTKNSKFWAEH